MRSPAERSAVPGSTPESSSPVPQVGALAEGMGAAASLDAAGAELRLAAMVRTSTALVAARSLGEVADVVVAEVVPALGASCGSLVMRGEGGDAVARVRGGSHSAAPRETLAPSAAAPLAEAIRTGAPIALEAGAPWRERYPGYELPAGCAGVLVLPCAAGSAVSGALELGFAEPILATDARGFGLVLAQQCAQAMERTQLYQRESKSRAHLKAVIAEAPVGIIVVEAGRERVALANPQAYALLGQDPARPPEAVPLYHPDGSAYVRAEWPNERALAGETVAGEEVAIVRGDGRRRTLSVSASPIRGEAGEVTGAMMVFMDVTERTERRRQERRQHVLAEAGRVLAQSLELEPTLAALSELAVSSVADLCVVDLLQPDGSLRRVSVAHRDPDQSGVAARIATMSGSGAGDYGLRAVLESGQAAVVHELDEQAFESLADRATLEPLARQLGLRSAAILPLSARGRTLGALTLAATRPGAYVPEELALASELALRAALAIDHALLYEEAQRAAREREEMVAIVSHDLRSPLNTISMASSLLLHPELPLERKLIQSGVIRRSVDQMSHLIRDLLDVSRLGAGQLQVHPSPESVRALLDDAAAAALPLAEAKRIHLETEVTTPRAARVLADRERVLQILNNLLENALRFTPEDGRIAVTAARDDGLVRFTVADSGAGIPPEELPHIFDRFWQGRRQEREGAGLGLAIVRGLVEAHGGSIDVSSTLDVGTTFTFTLPAA